TLFLWHQTAFLAVTTVGLAFGRLPGLHTAPVSGTWVAERIAWLPVFGIVLAALWLVFRLAGERGRLRLIPGLAARRARGLGREEQPGQDRPGRGDQAGHQAADGQAVHERVGGRGVDHLAGGGIPGGGDLAGDDEGRADRLVGYRGDLTGQIGGQAGGEPGAVEGGGDAPQDGDAHGGAEQASGGGKPRPHAGAAPRTRAPNGHTHP